MRVNLITGAAGAGKTTLLRAILRNGLQDEKGAVLVNAAAAPPLATDGLVFVGLLGAACWCCSAEGDLVRALWELREGGFDRVLLEAAPEANALRLSALLHQSPELRGRILVDVTFCVTDATTRAREMQVKGADLVLLNKCDLVSRAALAEREAEIAAMNPRAGRLQTAFAAADFRPLLYPGASAAGSPFVTWAWAEPGRTFHYSKLVSFLEALPAGVLRVDGQARTEGGTFRVRWLVGGLDLEPSPPGASELTFVGTLIDGAALSDGLALAALTPTADLAAGNQHEGGL
jgi:hypothetical protein